MIFRQWVVYFEPTVTMYGHTMQTTTATKPEYFFTQKGASRYLMKARLSNFVGGSSGKWVMRNRRRSE